MVDVPNTPGPVKYVALAKGVAIGAGLTALAEHGLTGPDRAEKLAERGIDVLDSRQASVYAMAIPLSVAAGISLGLQRRTPTAGLTTSSLLLAGALLTPMVGAVINANTPKAGDYVTGTAGVLAAASMGVMYGVRDEVPINRARLAGVGFFGAAIGAAAPFVIRSLAAAPGAVGRSIEHRER